MNASSSPPSLRTMLRREKTVPKRSFASSADVVGAAVSEPADDGSQDLEYTHSAIEEAGVS